jgi:hypothetical protein
VVWIRCIFTSRTLKRDNVQPLLRSTPRHSLFPVVLRQDFVQHVREVLLEHGIADRLLERLRFEQHLLQSDQERVGHDVVFVVVQERDDFLDDALAFRRFALLKNDNYDFSRWMWTHHVQGVPRGHGRILERLGPHRRLQRKTAVGHDRIGGLRLQHLEQPITIVAPPARPIAYLSVVVTRRDQRVSDDRLDGLQDLESQRVRTNHLQVPEELNQKVGPRLVGRDQSHHFLVDVLAQLLEQLRPATTPQALTLPSPDSLTSGVALRLAPRATRSSDWSVPKRTP